MHDDASQRADDLSFFGRIGNNGRHNVGDASVLKIKLRRGGFVRSGECTSRQGLNFFGFAENEQGKEHRINSHIELGASSELEVKYSSVRVIGGDKPEIRAEKFDFSYDA